MVGGTVLLALIVANIPNVLPDAATAHQGFSLWLRLTAVVSMAFCLAAIFMIRGVSRRLIRLTGSMLALAESYSGTAASFAGGACRPRTAGFLCPHRSQCAVGTNVSQFARAGRGLRRARAVGVSNRGLPHL